MAKKKSIVDLSGWNLTDEIIPPDWLEKKIIEIVEFVVEYTLKDEGKWGFWHDFQSAWDDKKHPLDLNITFPCLDENGKIGMEANLRDFVDWDRIDDLNKSEARKQYLLVAKELRKLADEIDARAA